MSSGKSSTTSQAGSRCFAALPRTRRADCGGRSDGRKPARYRRPGERPTFWPRRNAVRLAGGKHGRAECESGWRLPDLEVAIRLIMSVRSWRRFCGRASYMTQRPLTFTKMEASSKQMAHKTGVVLIDDAGAHTPEPIFWPPVDVIGAAITAEDTRPKKAPMLCVRQGREA
jgi:hypothetical protein